MSFYATDEGRRAMRLYYAHDPHAACPSERLCEIETHRHRGKAAQYVVLRNALTVLCVFKVTGASGRLRRVEEEEWPRILLREQRDGAFRTYCMK